MNKIIRSIYTLLSIISVKCRLRLAGVPCKLNYKIISLGLGQQSTTLYLMSSMGEIERADFAIFSDPGSEGSATYKHLKWLKRWTKRNKGIPILVVGKKSLYQDLIQATKITGKRFASIPLFTKDAKGKIGMLRRQCTEEYKTNEIFRTIRHAYGVRLYKRTPATEVWLGISLEEIERAKFPRTKWLTFVYPFLNIKATKNDFQRVNYTKIMRRADCQVWLEQHGFPVPPKSACTFCPYQSDARWKETKLNDPQEWKRLVHLDEQIRNSTKKGIEQPIFLHRSCQPLKDVDLHENQLDIFISECSGMCGI
jgi:hypothetical protein